MLNWKENIGKYANEKLVTFYISLLSITESIINPIPVEVILIPSVIKFREKFIKFALVAAVMSTIGAVIGYVLGFYSDPYDDSARHESVSPENMFSDSLDRFSDIPDPKDLVNKSIKSNQ